jgi:protein O-GlcNAc transferase
MTGAAALPEFEAATAHHRAGDVVLALRAYGRLLCQNASDGLLLHLIGVALHQLGHASEALRWLGRAGTVLGPEPLLLHNLGESARAVGDVERALGAYRRALTAQPELAESRISLSLLLRQTGMVDLARREARIAVAMFPAQSRALMALGLSQETIIEVERATAADPSNADAWVNLGAMRIRDTALGAAARASRRALVLAPAVGEAWINYGTIELGLSYPSRAVRLQKRGLTLHPTPERHSNLLFTMASDPNSDDAAQRAEALRWSRQFATSGRARASIHAAKGNDPGKPLIIGYLSADFRSHPVAGNIIEMVRRHDRSQFSVNCYAEVHRPDLVTDEFRRIADRWISTVTLSDADVAAAIRRDRVDILVVLGGHTASNRLAVAAWRPAPVQASYGAPVTTGLAEIDYWMTDPDLTPPEWDDRFVERVHRLPVMYTFQAPRIAIEPALGEACGPLLGSFNNPGKLNDAVYAAWSKILERAPLARLRLGYHGFFEDPALQRRVREAMPTVADRVDFLPRAGDAEAHLSRLRSVDLILDTFPFCGHNSTFDALWMGVPVITLAGDRFVGRVSAAICRNLDLNDLVAADVDEYVEHAVRLLGDGKRLQLLRQDLRGRLRRSAMMDYAQQAHALETAYRQMWRRYCGIS